MIFKKEQPPVEFICNDYAVRKHAPVLPASEYLPSSWTNMKTLAQDIYPGKRGNKTAKSCPAIDSYLEMGYIIPAHCDIDVTFDAPQEMGAYNGPGQPGLAKGQFDALDFYAVYSNPAYQQDGHLFWQLGKMLPDYKCRSVMKIHHPWWIKTAPGWSVMFLPLLYHQSPFHAVPGILDADKTHLSAPINLMIKEKTDFNIKMGTPLVQIVPFKRENINAVSRDSTEKDKERESKLISQLYLKFNGVSKYFRDKMKFSITRKDLDIDE